MISRGDSPDIHVFKIQLPLSSNAECPPCLVYNHDRSIMGEVSITKEIRDLFPPGVVKIFAEGTFIDGMIDLKGTLWPDPEAFDW